MNRLPVPPRGVQLKTGIADPSSEEIITGKRVRTRSERLILRRTLRVRERHAPLRRLP